MRYQNRNITKAMASNIGIRIPFTDEEAKEFNKYIDERCLKKGAYIRKVVLMAIRKEGEASSGK